MKKNFFLTLMLAVLCTAASWAQFAPEAGKMYAFREVTSGLFLDIQTLGINEPNANGTTNNISLSAKPCVIYFGASNGKYTMKNVNGTYAQQAGSRDWNAVIGTTAYEWEIADVDSDGYYTIARADGKFVKIDNATNGAPLYCNQDSGFEFALVEYSSIIPGVYTVKTATGTYLTQVEHSTGSKATLQEEAQKFKIMPTGNLFYFENNDVAGRYLGTTHQWNATFDFSLLQIVDVDAEGFAAIARAAESSKHVATNEATDKGRGIFTNVESGWNKWYFEGTYDYPTAGTNNGGKYHFTSDYITYAGACNKIRFTLTESGASFQNGKNRMSLDEFAIYDADGKKIELTVANVTGNNNKTYEGLFDGVNGKYGGTATWNDGTEDDWFEILLPAGVDLGGAFKFSFVTENTDMNAKKFSINTSYEKPADYTVVITAPQGKTVAVTYDGKTINTDDKVAAAGFDKSLVDATNISGYTWSVVVDDENKTVTIQYIEIEVVENPAAVVALIKRVGGENAAEQFKFVLDPSINSKNEVFVIGGEDGKVLIKGTTISAITTGIGWYLNNYAHINIAWNSLNEKTVSGEAYADLSNIPVPTGEERRTSDAMYRYYLNTCTFGYSMTSWTWKRWQQEIDWMALHGINMPLQLVGMEEVWRKFLTMEEGGKRKYGYTDEAAKAFVAGPAFIAWWAMNNLEGWGGTAPGSKSGYNNLAGAGGVQDDAWYARQKNLAKQITDRQRELGMQPVLPGWSGMVPTNFASKSGYATRGNGGNWAGDFVRPLLLSVGNANYAEIAADYYKCLHEVMGESRYYSMDPFHEGGGAGTMEDYEALYAAMETAKPGSQWVIQQWQWSATQKYSLTAVPAGRLIVLDLFSDGSPAFDGYNGYAPQDAVFCAIPNFGGRSGLMGRLNNLADNYFKFKGKYASIKGIGAAPEAIEQTPVTYDLIFQLPWMGTKPDVAGWVANYSIARYGVENTEVQAAWELLRQGVLNYGADGIQGPVEDVWAARPNLAANKASSWGKTLANAMGTYTKERQLMLIDATYKLLAQNAAITGEVYRSNYLYDIVEFGGGVMADYAYYLLLGIKEAKEASNTTLYEARRDAFLQIIRDMDTFRGTNLNFRLGKWTQEARAAAQEAIDLGATAANADWYEYNNARTILTTWSSPGTNLTDYSYRSWQGLLNDFYLPRWEAYFAADCGSLEYKFFEWNWAHGMTHAVGQTGISSTPLTAGQQGHTASYTREPQGNTVEEANKMLGKYIIPLKTDNGTTYAYRYLTNTLSAEYKVEGAEGGTINLSKFFLANIDGATVTGDFINGTANDIKAVPVKSGIAGNTYDAVMTLTDGTVVNFKVVVNSTEMVTAKEELAALIEKMEALTAQVGSYKSVGTVTDVTERLTTDGTAGTTEFYVWTNAQEDAEGPIKDLVDGDTETHFHSEYSTNVGANHFINIDLGDNNKISSFRFIYSTRKAETNFPKTIEVSGCNERTGTYEYITTVTNLPAGNSNSVVTYVSDRISCAKEYAYLRFTVTANNSGYNEAGGHPYFHMSEFGLEEVCATADVIDVYNGTELTDAFAAEKYDVLLAAKNVYKTATTPEQIAAATAKLQAAYDELSAKVEAQQPEEPVGFNGVYHINYNGNPIFPAYAAAGETAESWMDSDGYHLFNSGADEVPAAAQADVLFTIEPNNSGYTLSAQGLYMHSTPDALQTWHPMILSNDKNNAGVFLFEETAEQYFYKLKSDKDDSFVNYVNCWGKIFGNDLKADAVSTFTFEKVTEYTLTVPAGGATTLCLPFNVVLPQGVTAYDVVENSFETQNGLYKYTLTELAVAGKTLAKNTPVVIEAEPGNYTLKITMNNVGAIASASGSALRGNYWERNLAAGENNYQPAVTADGLVFNRVNAATTVAANTAWLKLTENKGAVIYKEFPEGPDAPTALTDGAVYRIKGLLADGTTYRTVYTNGAGNWLRWTSDAKNDATTLFVAQETADGKFNLVSALGNGLWSDERTLDEDGVGLTLLPGTVDGTFAIRGNGERVFSAHGGGTSGDMNMYSGGNQIVNDNETTNFVFEEVTDVNELAKVAFNKIIRKGNHYATLFLPYNVTVPENVKAYTATVENKDYEEAGVISLDEIADGIIPARTAVILRREDNTATGEFSFKYTTDASSCDYDGNLFGGRVTTGYVGSEPGQDNDKYYLLLNSIKGEALYKVYREYNSGGGYVGENNGGYIKCEGNKGYMKLDVANGASSSYSFRIKGSTGIEDVEGENGDVKAIYDLQGRKVENPGKGLYIINGKKSFIK